MKVYLVEVSIGQWSDHRSSIVAVFDKKENAEKHAEEIKRFYEIQKLKDAPYPEDDYFETGKLSEEQEAEYSAWSNMRYEADDFNNAYVIEMDVNDKDSKYLKESTEK